MPSQPVCFAMRRRSRGWLIVLSALAIVSTLVSCAAIELKSTASEQHPLDNPAVPPVVAVIPSREPPKTELLTPLHGPEDAAKAGLGGAAAGALTVYMLAPLALLAGPAGVLALPALLGGGAAVGLAAGAAAGVEQTVPPEEVAVIERAAEEAVSRLRLAELTAQVVASDIRRSAGLEATVVDANAAADAGRHRWLVDRGFGLAIELKVKQIGFTGSRADPRIALFMTAEARLLATATGRPAALRGLVYVSPQRAFRIWAKDGGALTSAEIERAYRTLAERIVEDLVLRANGEVERFGALGVEIPDVDEICGLVPRSPAIEWHRQFFAREHLVASRADSVTPLLVWEPTSYSGWEPDQPTDERPRAKSPSPAVLPNAPWANAKDGDSVYDVRIWSVVDDAPSTLVYERDGLLEPRHRLETPLEPKSTYFWSVRKRSLVDGRVRATRWSAANIPALLLSPSLRKSLFYFRRDDGNLKPAICPTPYPKFCWWLDYIPAENYFRFATP